MKSFIYNLKTNKKGFSLIELIISMLILSIALVGLLSLMSRIIAMARYNQNKIIALNLAREGIEIIRNVRDTNWLRACPTWGGSCTHWTTVSGTNSCCVWDSGLDSASDHTLVLEFDPSNNIYYLNYTPNDFSNSLTDIYLDDTNGVMSSSTYLTNASKTNYQRLITIDYICRDSDGTNEQIVSSGDCGTQKKVGLRVKSEVHWDNGDKTIALIDKIYNWR